MGVPTVGPIPPVARGLFGSRSDRVVRYVELLATDGVTRGLIGPREVPRLWERHILNCAALVELLEPGATVVDVGSGAGLPGVVLALARPDLTVALVESLARRTQFLTECRAELRLERVTVHRGRAEDRDMVAAVGDADAVISRAVAPLDRLAAWSLPLLRRGGRMLAVKGAGAEAEVATHADAVIRLGGSRIEVRRCGVGMVDPPATVVVVCRAGSPGGRGDR
ncbi:MAG TPA: 16S rRNA (guanine(527)-N(7))-methyltransferase RsmG [Mycobacteriales bacterium]|nr:16S rRNA (guanine(527)-N(7))-methyltransferase RsmG [Mycobacteriales bacterium]